MPPSNALPDLANSADGMQLARQQHRCPSCGNEVLRTWRRPVDRFTTVFVPVHRDRCEDFSCRWEGNFRTVKSPEPTSGVSAGDKSRQGVTGLFVAEILIVIAATLFIAMFSASDNWSFAGSTIMSSR